MKAAILILAFLFAAGCAGTRIRPVESSGSGEPARLAAALDSYNMEGSTFRVLGEARWKSGPRIGFGARAVAGRAFRMDGVASPSTRTLFSAACAEGGGCEVYIPEEGKVYRVKGGQAADWLSMIVSGRVPTLGEPLSAGHDPSGAPVLYSEDHLGQWAQVVFDSEGRLPVRAVYGEPGGKPRLELVFAEFFTDGGVSSPGEVLVGGESEGDEFLLRVERIELTGEMPVGAFQLRIPDGVRAVDSDGSAAWKKLGMFWMPKN